MRLDDIELPPPGPGEARLRHTAIALNFSDINVRRGGFYQKDPLPMPIILGNEAAGVVTALGAGRHRGGGRRPGRLLRHGLEFLGQNRRLCARSATCRRAAGEAARRRLRPAGRGADAQGADRVEHRQPHLPAEAGRRRAWCTPRRAASGSLLVQWSKHFGATVLGTVGNAGQGAHRQGARLRPHHPLSRGGFRRRGEAHRARAASTRCSTASASTRSRSRSTAWRRSA